MCWCRITTKMIHQNNPANKKSPIKTNLLLTFGVHGQQKTNSTALNDPCRSQAQLLVFCSEKCSESYIIPHPVQIAYSNIGLTCCCLHNPLQNAENTHACSSVGKPRTLPCGFAPQMAEGIVRTNPVHCISHHGVLQKRLKTQ